MWVLYHISGLLWTTVKGNRHCLHAMKTVKFPWWRTALYGSMLKEHLCLNAVTVCVEFLSPPLTSVRLSLLLNQKISPPVPFASGTMSNAKCRKLKLVPVSTLTFGAEYMLRWQCDFLIKPKVVRFQVLTAASMMFRIIFWDVLPCKMIVDRRFRGDIPEDNSEQPEGCLTTRINPAEISTINPLKSKGNYIYQPLNHQQHYSLYLSVLYDSQCKQQLCPWTTLANRCI
jgi:hypothetical protein